MSTPTDLLLAHSLYPEFPSLGVLLLMVLVGGAVFAFVASRRSRHVLDETDATDTVAETSPAGTKWLGIPAVTLVACGVAVPLSLVPGPPPR